MKQTTNEIDSQFIDYLCSRDDFIAFLAKALNQDISAFEVYRQFEKFKFIGDQHFNELNNRYEQQADFFDSVRE